jgi:hypothetical protein
MTAANLRIRARNHQGRHDCLPIKPTGLRRLFNERTLLSRYAVSQGYMQHP